MTLLTKVSSLPEVFRDSMPFLQTPKLRA